MNKIHPQITLRKWIKKTINNQRDNTNETQSSKILYFQTVRKQENPPATKSVYSFHTSKLPMSGCLSVKQSCYPATRKTSISKINTELTKQRTSYLVNLRTWAKLDKTNPTKVNFEVKSDSNLTESPHPIYLI